MELTCGRWRSELAAPRCSVSLLTAMMLLDVTRDVWMLPAPSGVSMESVNMKHTLRWLPLQASCNTTVLYSVQYQGEFELLLQDGRWLDAAECQLIPYALCDLTFDLGSDSDYNVRVRARCGLRRSDWSGLSRPFNRRDTVVTPPDVKVTTAGDVLQVSFDRLPLTSTVSVRVWKKGEDLQAVVHSMPAEQKQLTVPALQAGTVYCVRAQTVLDAQLKSSNTDTQCVTITGPDAATWRRPTTLTLTVVITAGLLFAVFWSVIHCRPDVCQTFFHKELLPGSLKGDWKFPQHSVRPQEEEGLCEQISVVLSVDPAGSTSQQAD
ncbi:interleukin-20 receptor subunit beta [Parambassis ranga]|uniref:Interleukin-20 receptor subunit beta n=1 Tax=Parambassis ranga TaxID=210632 RepID=A0A6P7K1Z3_9TELE|nr:interleukin-20 receptor subunit beta-like [Parambassis ranga]